MVSIMSLRLTIIFNFHLIFWK